jgi:hypothetical protein
MTPCAPFATTYGETLEYPCGLYDRPIVLPPAKATLPFTIALIIIVAHPSASTNFGEMCLLGNSVNRPAADAPKLAYWHHALVETVPATKERL